MKMVHEANESGDVLETTLAGLGAPGRQRADGTPGTQARGGWRPYLTQRVGSGAREAATSKTKAGRSRHRERSNTCHACRPSTCASSFSPLRIERSYGLP